MLETTCTRRLEWDAAHRVLGHEGRCRFLHGHRYAAEFTCKGMRTELDKLDMVIDFGVIKTVMGEWIDEHLDHNIMLNPKDPLLRDVWVEPNKSTFGGKEIQKAIISNEIFRGRAPYTNFYNDGNAADPTAEKIAQLLFNISNQLLFPFEVDVVRVRVYETPSSFADVGHALAKEV